MKIHPKILAAIEECGPAAEIQNGARHIQVLIHGRRVLVLSRGRGDDGSQRRIKNAVANIRRAMRQLEKGA